MKRTHKIMIGILSGLSLGMTAVASANPGFGPGSGPGCMHEHGMGPGIGPGMGMGMGMGPGMKHGQANPAAMAEGHLAWLKAELKITSAQEGAWKIFADQKRQQAEAMQTWLNAAPEKAPATAVERMEQHNQWARKHLAQEEQMTASLKSLYAALSVEQKAKLDQGLAHGGPGHHHGPGGQFR